MSYNEAERFFYNYSELVEIFTKLFLDKSNAPHNYKWIKKGGDKAEDFGFYSIHGMEQLFLLGIKEIKEFKTAGVGEYVIPKGIKRLRVFLTGAGGGAMAYKKGNGFLFSPGGAAGNTIVTEFPVTGRPGGLPNIKKIDFNLGSGGEGAGGLTHKEIVDYNKKTDRDSEITTIINPLYNKSIVAKGGMSYAHVDSSDTFHNFVLNTEQTLESNAPFRLMSYGMGSVGSQNEDLINNLTQEFAKISASPNKKPLTFENYWRANNPIFQKFVKLFIPSRNLTPKFYNPVFLYKPSSQKEIPIRYCYYGSPYGNVFGNGGASFYGDGGNCGEAVQMNDTDFGHSPLIYLPKDGEDGKAYGSGGGGCVNPFGSIGNYLINEPSIYNQIREWINNGKGGSGADGYIRFEAYA